MPFIPIAITIILFCIGIVGTIVPLIPGAGLVWGAMLLFGIMTGFPPGLTLGFFICQAVAAVLVMSVDYMTTALGAKRSGGSKAATWGAAIGLLLGIIILGPFGIILGPFLGALIGELVNGIPLRQATRASFGALIGLLGGVIIKLVIVGVMIFWFIQRITPLW